MPIYLTEFGVQSKPNKYLGVPVSKQAEYDAIAEQIAYSNPRVAAFSQYLLKDDPIGGAPGSSVNGGTIGFQTGLEYCQRHAQAALLRLGRCRSRSRKTRPRLLAVGTRAPGRRGATKVTVLVRCKGSTQYRTLQAASPPTAPATGA